MGKNRLVFINWIAESGLAVDKSTYFPPNETELERINVRAAMIRQRVGEALRRLSEEEKEFVERFYYIGQGYREISEKSGRTVYKLEAVHKRAFRKLKKELAPMVKEFYDLDIEKKSELTCPLCRSPYREEIDRLIGSRDRQGTWRPIIKVLREKYGLKINTPQILVGHEKYH